MADPGFCQASRRLKDTLWHPGYVPSFSHSVGGYKPFEGFLFRPTQNRDKHI
jgi:hypothetical protein